MSLTIPAPSLDTWTSLFLPVAGQGLFLAFLLWQRSSGRRHIGWWLPALVLAFSVLLLFNVSFWTRYNWYFPPINLAYPTLAFLIGPFLLFYLDGLAEKPQFIRFRLLHFLPALLVFLLSLPGYLHPLTRLQAQMEATQFIRTPLHALGLQWLEAPLFITLHLILYAGLVLWYGSWILSQQNGEDKVGEKPQVFRARILLLLSLFTLYTLAFISYYILVRMAFFKVEHDYLISWVMAAAIYLIGYLEYRQAGRVDQPLTARDQAPKYSSSSLTPAAVTAIATRLEIYMQEAHPYRENELRLPDLAETLEISPHQLSQVINERYGKTFNQFINEYRIREAMDLLSSEKHREDFIIEIAYQVGFNNKTTFNQAFKLQTGMSPSKWRSR